MMDPAIRRYAAGTRLKYVASVFICLSMLLGSAVAQGELRFCLHAEP